MSKCFRKKHIRQEYNLNHTLCFQFCLLIFHIFFSRWFVVYRYALPLAGRMVDNRISGFFLNSGPSNPISGLPVHRCGVRNELPLTDEWTTGLFYYQYLSDVYSKINPMSKIHLMTELPVPVFCLKYCTSDDWITGTGQFCLKYIWWLNYQYWSYV